jgi:nitric-oxide synthase
MKFHGEELDAGRPVHADWKWIVPPISGSTVEAFHMDLVNKILKPNYFYQQDPWKSNDWRSLSKV